MGMTLETNRLFLKTSELGFAASCSDYYRRNREFLAQYEPERDEIFYTPEYQLEILKKEIAGMEAGTICPFYLFRKEEPETVIGKISLNNIVRGAFLSCFYGVKMDQAYINQGYMTEALKRAIQYAFDELGLHRIEGNIMPRNIRSLRVAEKCGFQSEGIAEKYLRINGVWEDHVHMVIRNQAMEGDR